MKRSFEQTTRWLRRNLLNITLLLMAAALAMSVDALVQIQQSRMDYCRAQNARHDNTVAFLDRYVSQYEKKHHLSGAQLKAVQGQAQANLTLIQDLQPHLNCQNSTSSH